MTDILEIDRDLADLLDSVFGEYAESGRATPGELDREFWDRLDGLGLVRLTGDEAHGGSGAGWAEAVALISAAAAHGVRLPLAEHDLLAEWLRRTTELDGPTAVRTACLLDATGRANAVPWLGAVDRAVVIWPVGDEYRAADIAVSALTVTRGANAIGEPRDGVVVDLATLDGVEVAPETVRHFERKAAMIRGVQVCAALDRTLALAAEHVRSREQFGRPIAKFQAVQSVSADIAGEAALARAATESALLRAISSNWSAPDLDFLVAVARSCAGHAASVVVRGAHQVHGAIGTTLEHRLHTSTRAALAWRSEYGSLRSWDERVTEAALRAGAPGLWQLIAG
ncbi:acyl-CoA dehydrogenase family protein [Nocardia sp. NPDC004068]|uniref:acyl-CoA dehydrogenase family protein n=1 Tax=Nocardia sp. NPDC004068 TaxID=3364303 RepID=UPI0036CBB8B5